MGVLPALQSPPTAASGSSQAPGPGLLTQLQKDEGFCLERKFSAQVLAVPVRWAFRALSPFPTPLGTGGYRSPNMAWVHLQSTLGPLSCLWETLGSTRHGPNLGHLP